MQKRLVSNNPTSRLSRDLEGYRKFTVEDVKLLMGELTEIVKKTWSQLDPDKALYLVYVTIMEALRVPGQRAKCWSCGFDFLVEFPGPPCDHMRKTLTCPWCWACECQGVKHVVRDAEESV